MMMTALQTGRNRPSLSGLTKIQMREHALDGRKVDPEEWASLQYEKWCFIHDQLVTHPFQVSKIHSRSEQWRRVRDHLKKVLDEPKMTDWVILQIDVATNLANGIHEMRPRKRGPCYDVLMEWVINRKHKTRAVMQWVKGEFIPGFPTFNKNSGT
jgi:hypothetical protein